MEHNKTVIILGASVAGLAMAAALAKEATKVIILDKDSEPLKENGYHRNGLPHDFQGHALIGGGRLALEKMLPGFSERAEKNGAIAVSRTKDILWYTKGNWQIRFDDHQKNMHLFLRPIIDLTMRQLLCERFGDDKIDIRWNTRVNNIDLVDDRVVGVVLKDGTKVSADLVVDCMGKNSPMENWLNQFNYRIPEQTKLRVNLVYCTAIIEFDDPLDIHGLIVAPEQQNMHAGAFVQIDNSLIRDAQPGKQYIICTLYGYHEHRPTEALRTWEDYLAFARQLPDPAIYDRLKAGRLKTQPRLFALPNQFWRRYDKCLDKWPKGLLISGDSFCTFDPAFGQGMGTAMTEAYAVHSMAKELVTGEGSKKGMKKIAGCIPVPFYMNAIEDNKYKNTTGVNIPFVSIIHSFANRAFRAAAKDSVIWGSILRVAHLEASPLLLARPDILLRVIFKGGNRKRSEKLPPSAETEVLKNDTGPIDIILAEPRGFCAGVDRAIEIVERALVKHGAPVYVRHEIVHNTYVVNNLRSKGAVFIDNLNDVPPGATLVFSAHGVPKSVEQDAYLRGFRVFDATCPLVSRVHVEVKEFHEQGYEIIMIGHQGHPEVEGTLGQLKSGIHLVENIEDVALLQPAQVDKLAVITQTTLSVDDTAKIIGALRERYPEIHTPKKQDICYATQNRQDAVKKLAPRVDMVIVVGSPNSSNSNRLREVAQNLGVKAWMVDNPDELKQEWFEGCSSVGLTAGASAPEVLVQQVIRRIKTMKEVSVQTLEGVQEKVNFQLPVDLR